MKRALLPFTALALLGCIDLDIITGSETAGSTTSMTGATSSDGDGDGDSTTSGPGTDGDGDGESSDSTETGTETGESESGDGDGEVGDGDADPGDGDGEGSPTPQICMSNTIVYWEPGPACAPNTWHACFVGEFGVPNAYALACCSLALDSCYVATFPGECLTGASPMCEIN
jgi:hypothetical protein